MSKNDLIKLLVAKLHDIHLTGSCHGCQGCEA
jgi:hypothetical protein